MTDSWQDKDESECIDHLLKFIVRHNDHGSAIPLASVVAAAGIWGVQPPPVCLIVEHNSSFFKEEKNDEPNQEVSKYACSINWTHGGAKVAVTGDFTDWSFEHAIELIRAAGRQFTAILELPMGVHRYKFIVDGTTWHYCPDQPQEIDSRGNVNNVLNMTEFDPNWLKKLSEDQKFFGPLPKDYEAWNQRIPQMEELTVDCPTAPPQIHGATKLDAEINGDSTVINRVFYICSREMDRRPGKYEYVSQSLVVTSINIPNVLLNTRIPDERRANITFGSRDNMEECHDPVLNWLVQPE